MSLPRLPQLGSVVWVELTDANGFRKVRPAVVVSATTDIAAEQPVRVVAITTWIPTPLPDDHVLLSWDRQGKARLAAEVGRRFLFGEGWHSNENAVRFWTPSSRVPKEADTRCYAYTTAYATMTPLCNVCCARSKMPPPSPL